MGIGVLSHVPLHVCDCNLEIIVEATEGLKICALLNLLTEISSGVGLRISQTGGGGTLTLKVGCQPFI